MKKRVLSMFMALALCLTLLPAPVRAAEDTPESGAIVQEEQQEAPAAESPAISEQAAENGIAVQDGEDSKADAPEIGEDENAGNNAETAVSAVQTMIDAMPTVSELDGMTAGELDAAYNDIQAAYNAYEALNAEQQAQITGADFEALLGWFNSQTAPLADAQSGVHTHCVCGKDSSTTVNGHTHNTGTTWTATDALPSTAGSYYLTQSVTADWTVPTGEVNLCLNGQTINGKITVGGATLTLTDCSGNGKVQGEVTVNGGKFELYSGTITGGVQVGIKGGTYQTGSSFTMYGGAITGNKTDSGSGGGVFLVGTTNQTDPPRFTMHGGTISDNTAGASDGGGGGVYVGEKCSFTMDGGTITGNTATNGNGGGIYIHFNAGNVSISNATITGNKASATGNTSYGHGGGIYSERGVTVKNVTITGNSSTFEGGGIYGNGTIALTDATVTGNNQYDVYYGGSESSAPKLTISGLVQAGYYANYAWKLPILVSGALSEDSVIRVGVREGIKPGYGKSLAIAEPASGVTLSAENFKADTAESETSLGKDGKIYLSPCEHEMDDTGYTCKKCHTQFDARIGESAYYKTLKDAFLNAWDNSTITLMRDVNLNNNCSASNIITLDLHGKTITSENKFFNVNKELTVKDSSEGGGTQALNVKFSVDFNGTLAVDDSYTGDISYVALRTGGTLEAYTGTIKELRLEKGNGTGYSVKLWKDNAHCCTVKTITLDKNANQNLTVGDLLGTDYAKCELYGEKDGAWSIVPKTEKISELTGYTAYKVQFTECVHQCADDSNPVCSVCHKDLYTKITAKAADGTTKTAYFTEDSALENGYVEAIQTLNGWSNEGCTEPTLTLLRNMDTFGISMTLTGTLTLEGGTHTAKNVTVAEGADVTFASGSYQGATINGTATVKEGVTFTDASVTVNGTLNAKGGTFNGSVEFNGSSTANISGGSFNCEKKYGGVTFDYNVTGTISGGTFAFADFYTTKVKLSGGTFTTIKTNGDRKLADLLAEGAAYYGASDNQAVTNDRVNTLENVKVVSHTHNGGKDDNGTCSICGKQMAASLTVGGKTSWYAAFATAIEAANAADGEKTITLYQDVDGNVYGKRTAYELTRGPVTLATGGKRAKDVDLIAKGISLTVTGSNGDFYVTVDGKDAELTVNDKDTELAIVTAKNGGKLSLSNGTFSRVAVKDDGSSASLSGGSYGEITSDTGYVKPYALLAKGYAYKKTKDNQWLPNANSIPSEVTVEKAPFVVEKIYPNSDTNYTGNSAFATDGNITLTAVIASEPETENVTYYYWWELFNESENDWTTSFKKVNTATHTGEKSNTLTISGLPVDKSYQYHIFVQCSNGYQCYSEPFTVTQHQHSWTYSASGATITAKCTAEGCYLTDGNGGSVTIKAPAELTYSGEGKPATVTASSDWQGPAASEITISYIKTGKYGPEKLENDALPTKAGEYTASITVGEGNKAATASVEYTIQKANPVVTEWPTLSASVYVNSEATLTGGSGEGTFAFKAGTDKSWDSTGNKTTTVVFTPTDTNNYKELIRDYTVTVVKRTVKSCNTLVGITDKHCGTAQEELELPGTVTITTVDGKTFDKIPVAWNDYNPDTLEEQTLTGTLDLTSIAGEVEQPSTPVTAQIKVKLTQKNFSGISPEAYDGVYDGKAHGITLTGVPSGATVKYGTSVNSCTQDSLTYTNFTNGPKIVFYKVSQFGYADASGSAWVNIAKRPLTVSNITENKTYVYASGSDDKAIGVDIAGKLPPDRGTTIYTVAKKDPEQLLSEVTVDTAGNLTYKVNQVDSSKVGKTAIITVTASMENYENVEYTLTINITDKKTVEIKRGNTVSVDGSNALTYGEKVSKLTLGNTVFVETGTDDMIEGILSWSNPDEIPAAGTTQAGWVFRPADSRHYAELTGTAAITVAKATPAVVTVPAVAEREYNPVVALADSDMTGGSVTGADGSSLAGTWSFTGTIIIPTVNNKGYQAVFTPDDADNYNTVTRTITVKVTKATPVIAQKPTAGALTYGQELSDSTLTGGKAVYQTADGTEITGAFAWKNSSIKPTAADSQKTEYDVTFTPSDKDNYNAVDTKLTLTVNKAAQAPNMPQAAMAPAHSTKKVGDITLPDGWTWQEADKDTALADGVAVTANALYTGTDRGNYETESVSITITRSECEHKNTEIINKKDATCSVEGYTGDTYCKDCGETLATGTAIEKKPHTVKTSATCISKAVCSVCGETFGEVDANNHVHTTVKNLKEATCTQTGYTGDTYCTDCNKLLGMGKELAALGHDYKATVTKQPTTTEEGIRTYTCTRCNSSYIESIAKLPEEQHTHNYTGSITKEATCTEAGVRTYTCSCGDSYTENIPATGHSYVSKVTKAATTTEEGIMTYTCSKCGHSYTQPIAKIKSDDSSKNNGNGNQNQKPQPDTDNGKDNGTSIKPYIKDDSGKEGWDVIKPQLEEAKSGDTVTVAMNGTTVVPKDVIDSIKGKDTTLVLDMGNGLSWKIYGKDITDAAGDIDFDVTVGADAGKSIPVDVINNVTGERSSLNLTLAYDGEFGFTATLTVNMESKNAGLYANLFYYNEQTGELEFISAGQIDPDGNVELVFTHASDYTIVVDAKIMSDNGQADNKADETIPASKTDDSTSKYAWNNTIIIIIGICIILIVFGAVFYVRKKSGSEEE